MMRFEPREECLLFEPGRWFAQCHASCAEWVEEGVPGVVWFAGEREGARDVAIWFSKRQEGRWSDPVVIADHEGIPCWNPVLCRRGEGDLLLFYKMGEGIGGWRTMRKHSSDGGETWSQARELVPGDTSGGRGPVRSKCLFSRHHKGLMIAPASVETEDAWDCFVDRSWDGGETWSRGGFVPLDHASFDGLGIIQPVLWEDGAGVLHMLARSTCGSILRSHSLDRGETWAEAERTALPNNNSGIDIVRVEDGRLVLACNPVAGNWAARTPIALSFSEDEGETWSPPQTIEEAEEGAGEGPPELSYPSLLTRGSELCLTYTFRRRSIRWRSFVVT